MAKIVVGVVVGPRLSQHSYELVAAMADGPVTGLRTAGPTAPSTRDQRSVAAAGSSTAAAAGVRQQDRCSAGCASLFSWQQPLSSRSCELL